MANPPKVIKVDLAVELVRRLGGVDSDSVQVHGFVGDYHVAVYMTAAEARQKGLI